MTHKKQWRQSTNATVVLNLLIFAPPPPPREDAEGLSREYVLRIPSMS